MMTQDTNTNALAEYAVTWHTRPAGSFCEHTGTRTVSAQDFFGAELLGDYARW